MNLTSNLGVLSLWNLSPSFTDKYKDMGIRTNVSNSLVKLKLFLSGDSNTYHGCGVFNEIYKVLSTVSSFCKLLMS